MNNIVTQILYTYPFTTHILSDFIKNVSSSSSHKKTPSLRPSLGLYVREFKKILPNTFIYKSILIKIYVYTNSMNTQIFYLKKYDLKGH